jgi:uncharacterized protein YcfJ
MRPKNGLPNGPWKAALLIWLAATLAGPGLSAAERKGSKVVVTKLSAQVLRGELLSVSDGSLTVLDMRTSAAVAVDLAEVEKIEVIDKGKRAGGAILGAIAGGLIGALAGSGAGSSGSDSKRTASLATASALGCGLAGAALAGSGDSYRVNTADRQELTRLVARLKKYAREQD